MDRIGDIGLFLRVLDLGSISGAARSLDLSVAVAIQRLQRLERDLGVRLLHRTTRRLHATPEGAILAEQGRALVEDLDALGSSARSISWPDTSAKTRRGSARHDGLRRGATGCLKIRRSGALAHRLGVSGEAREDIHRFCGYPRRISTWVSTIDAPPGSGVC